MSKFTTDYLRDMLRELGDVAAFTMEGEEAFMTDLRTQKAVIRSYEVVGEIAKRLPGELRNEYPEIDWRRLTNFCDFLAHNYELIVLRNVWEAVEGLPNLRAAVESVLTAEEAKSTGDDGVE